MAKIETCFDCVYSYWDRCQIPWCLSVGYPVRPVCGNQPDFPGRMRPCPFGKVCRNYRPRVPTPQGDVKQIPLGEGFFAYVDAADFEWLNQWTWHVRGGYAARRPQRKTVFMHREIMQPPEGMVVDHLNRNKLDNTRTNLRNCTHRENACNRGKKRGASSRFRGVSCRTGRKRWRAKISLEGEPVYLGSFAEEIEAARAYDRAAVEYFADSANLNFPEEWPPERRQQVYSHQAAANRPAGATHASGSQTQTSASGAPSPVQKRSKRAAAGKGKTQDAKRKTKSPTPRDTAAKTKGNKKKA